MTRVDWSGEFRALRCRAPGTSGVLRVTLAPGTAANRMTAALHRDLAALWPAVAGDPAVRAVLLRSDDEDFCGGTDPALIAHAVAADATARAALLEESRAIVLGAVDCAVPVVGAVRGLAVGAALGVALLADACVVGPSTRLADGHARVGVVAGDHAVLIWPLLCGLGRARRILLLGDVVDGVEAERIGLVSDCVADGDVEARAEALATRLAALPPEATRWTKRALGHWLRLGLPAFDASLAYEMLSYALPGPAEAARQLTEGRSEDLV